MIDEALSNRTRPIVGITMGDPAGIGPEITLKALVDPRVLRSCVPVVYGDVAVLRRVAELLSLDLPPSVCIADWRNAGMAPESAIIVDCGVLTPEEVCPGVVSAACGKAAYTYLAAAVADAKSGRISAISTAPLHKEALHAAGVNYPGHTEILAALTHTERYCMMLACDELCIGFVTTHVALADVSRILSVERVYEVIRLTAEAAARLRTPSPRLCVCGLNPHAGEGGLFGEEEQNYIVPAIKRALAEGLRVEGPIPPDTAFLPERRDLTDAYVAMYHDQGHIPFKMQAFDRGVNITLGLPIVRTSVDHGTAFDIAWKGIASPNSLVQAIRYAVQLKSFESMKKG